MAAAMRGARVALYLRVSTAKQATDGHGLDAQRHRLTQFATDRGLEAVEVVVDEGVSGKSLDRAGVRRVLELADAGAIDAVIVTKADRISRSLRDLLNLGAELDDRGVSLVTADEQVDTSTPLGKAMAQMRGVFAELERGMAASRTRDGMAAAKAKGVRLGRPPVGWSIVDGEMVPNDRYPIVERAHRMKSQGARLLDIATALNDDGVPTGSGRGGWAPGSVARLLKSPLAPEPTR